MKSLSEIKSEFDAILSNMEISGASAKVLSLLLSQSVYEGQMNGIKLALEASFANSYLLNSRITHAANHGYSVYRGSNQRLLVSGIKVINVPLGTTRKITKYSIAADFNSFKLVYAQDYEVKTGDTPTLELVVVDKDPVLDKTISITKSGSIAVLVTDSDISEDVIIFPTTISTVEQDTTASISKLTRNTLNVYNQFLVTTISDFGIRIANYNQFLENDQILVKYLKFTDLVVDTSTITNIPGYEVVDDTLSVIVKSFPIPRLVDKDKIYLYAVTEFLSNKVVRSNSDLYGIIGDYFKSRLRGYFITKESNNDVLHSSTKVALQTTVNDISDFLVGDSVYVKLDGTLEDGDTLSIASLVFNAPEDISLEAGSYVTITRTAASTVSVEERKPNSNITIYYIPDKSEKLVANSTLDDESLSISTDQLFNNEGDYFRVLLSADTTSQTEFIINEISYTNDSGFNFQSGDIVKIVKSGTSNKINVYSGDTSGDPLTALEIQEFTSSIKTAYFIEDKFTFVSNVDVSYNLNINVFYTSTPPISEINTILDRYETIVGKDFNPYKLISDIQDLDQVKYVSFPNGTTISNVSLELNNTIKFNRSGIVYTLYDPT